MELQHRHQSTQKTPKHQKIFKALITLDIFSILLCHLPRSYGHEIYRLPFKMCRICLQYTVRRKAFRGFVWKYNNAFLQFGKENGITVCDGCCMPTRYPYSSGHLVPSHLGLAYVLLLQTDPFFRTRYFSGLCSSNTPQYFLDFASRRKIKIEIGRPPPHFTKMLDPPLVYLYFCLISEYLHHGSIHYLPAPPSPQ